EMVHLAFPLVDDTHRWLAEGMATYIEPIGRMRTGIISPERVWSDLVKNLPDGLPKPGDRGLDHTHTWGRTYWGGALFCLLADLQIRTETGGRSSLETALRGALAAGGDVRATWTLDEMLKAADRATGVDALTGLHEPLGPAPA